MNKDREGIVWGLMTEAEKTEIRKADSVECFYDGEWTLETKTRKQFKCNHYAYRIMPAEPQMMICKQAGIEWASYKPHVRDSDCDKYPKCIPFIPEAVKPHKWQNLIDFIKAGDFKWKMGIRFGKLANDLAELQEFLFNNGFKRYEGNQVISRDNRQLCLVFSYLKSARIIQHIDPENKSNNWLYYNPDTCQFEDEKPVEKTTGKFLVNIKRFTCKHSKDYSDKVGRDIEVENWNELYYATAGGLILKSDCEIVAAKPYAERQATMGCKACIYEKFLSSESPCVDCDGISRNFKPNPLPSAELPEEVDPKCVGITELANVVNMIQRYIKAGKEAGK
jgi:hypothetical protein